MAQLTERYEIKLSENQIKIIDELRRLKICPSKFIRLALEEKIERDYKTIVKTKGRLVPTFFLYWFIQP